MQHLGTDTCKSSDDFRSQFKTRNSPLAMFRGHLEVAKSQNVTSRDTSMDMEEEPGRHTPAYRQSSWHPVGLDFENVVDHQSIETDESIELESRDVLPLNLSFQHSPAFESKKVCHQPQGISNENLLGGEIGPIQTRRSVHSIHDARSCGSADGGQQGSQNSHFIMSSNSSKDLPCFPLKMLCPLGCGSCVSNLLSRDARGFVLHHSCPKRTCSPHQEIPNEMLCPVCLLTKVTVFRGKLDRKTGKTHHVIDTNQLLRHLRKSCNHGYTCSQGDYDNLREAVKAIIRWYKHMPAPRRRQSSTTRKSSTGSSVRASAPSTPVPLDLPPTMFAENDANEKSCSDMKILVGSPTGSELSILATLKNSPGGVHGARQAVPRSPGETPGFESVTVRIKRTSMFPHGACFKSQVESYLHDLSQQYPGIEALVETT